MKPIRLEEFREYAKTHNVVPVAESFLADSETPLTLYAKLAGHRENTFLLESAEHGGAWSRYSFIGVNSEATLTEEAGRAIWIGRPPAGAPVGIDPLEALRITSAHLRAPRIKGLPRLTSGLVGYMGYDAVRRLESLPSTLSDLLNLPEIAFILTTDLAIYDHLQGTVTLIANAINWDGSDDGVDEAYEAALVRLGVMREALKRPIQSTISHIDARPAPSFRRLTESDSYIKSVESKFLISMLVLLHHFGA